MRNGGVQPRDRHRGGREHRPKLARVRKDRPQLRPRIVRIDANPRQLGRAGSRHLRHLSPDTGAFAPLEMNILRSLSDLAAIAILNQRCQEELRESETRRTQAAAASNVIETGSASTVDSCGPLPRCARSLREPKTRCSASASRMWSIRLISEARPGSVSTPGPRGSRPLRDPDSPRAEGRPLGVDRPELQFRPRRRRRTTTHCRVHHGHHGEEARRGSGRRRRWRASRCSPPGSRTTSTTFSPRSFAALASRERCSIGSPSCARHSRRST